jgi:hypothetical protein
MNNKLDEDSKVINLSNILKNESIITLNDYEKYKLNEEYNKLYTNSKIETTELKEEKENNRFYNLSLKNVFDNLVTTIVNIINEISVFTTDKDNLSKKDLIEIFTKDDRLIYIGIFLVIISLLLFFIKVSS